MRLSDITNLLNHDINCLSVEGADRFKRRQALRQLRSKIVNLGMIGCSRQVSDDLRDDVILDLLSKPLVLSLKDPSESCRLEALELLRQLIPTHSENIMKFLDEIIPVVLEQIEPTAEKSEEIRLSLIQFLTSLLSKLTDSAELVRHHAVLVKIASKALSDPFPDLKLQACSMVITLASLSADACDFQALLPILLSNLKHQRQKVRSDSLSAVFALIHTSSNHLPKWFHEEVLPALANLASDRSNHVREILFNQVLNILASINISRGPVLSSLLVITLSGLSDENDDVRKQVELRVSATSFNHDPSLMEKKDYRSLLCENISDLLRSHLLPMMSAWTSVMRLNASRMLQTFISIVQADITSYVDRVIPCIVHALNDDDHDDAASLCQAVFLLGQHADLDATLQAIYSGLAESVSHLNDDRTKRYLRMSCFFLRGIATRSTSLSSDYISSILSLDNIYTSTNPQLVSQCIQFLDTCIECVPSSCKAYEFRLFFVLLQIVSLHPGLGTPDIVLDKLSTILGLESKSALFERHFSAVVEHCRDVISSDAQQLLCLIQHAAPSMTYDHTHAVVSLLTKSFSGLDERSDRSDADNLMNKLTSLMTAVSNMFQVTPGIEIFIDSLISNVISRCLIWHVGRAAASLRLKAIDCLIIGSQRESLLECCSSSVLDQISPQIVSCLDDYSLDIRIGSLSLVQALIKKPKIPISIPDSLSKELLGRLDDSSDQVRIQVCSVLMDLYTRSNYDKRETLLSDISSTALIHLDDPNPDVQAAVYSLLSHLRDSDRIHFQKTTQNLDVKLMTSPYVNKLFNDK